MCERAVTCCVCARVCRGGIVCVCVCARARACRGDIVCVCVCLKIVCVNV